MTDIAILVRVSTNQQETARQQTELTNVATQRGWNVAEVIEEHGVSGSSEHRPGLVRAIELAHAGTIHKVLVHEVSRVARTNSTAHKFIEDLAEAGVSLYWHAQGMETLLPNGKRNPAAALIFSILAEQSRAEKETLVDRIKSGLAEAKRNGRVLGRPVGTKLPPKDYIARYPAIVRNLKAGKSIRDVAAITGKAKATVEKVKKQMIAAYKILPRKELSECQEAV